jgi:hypothetical protein
MLLTRKSVWTQTLTSLSGLDKSNTDAKSRRPQAAESKVSAANAFACSATALSIFYLVLMRSCRPLAAGS